MCDGACLPLAVGVTGYVHGLLLAGVTGYVSWVAVLTVGNERDGAWASQ